MKLFHVTITITGADHGLDQPQELCRLSTEFPFVEWGILFSPSKQGDLRYPTIEWRDELFKACDEAENEVNLSAHLCGAYARDFLFNRTLMLPSRHFKRVQINTTQKNFQKADMSVLSELVDELAPHVEIIFQYRGGLQDNKKVVEMSAFNESTNRFAALYDISGGKGILPKDWCLPLDNVRTGYAGGLNPDNLEEQLTKIAEVVGDRTVSIDMESGVRTNNEFDLSKVRRCLELASKWV